MNKFNLSSASKPVANINLYGRNVYLYQLFTSDLETFIALLEKDDCYKRIKKFLPSIAGFSDSELENLKKNREPLSDDFLEKISNSDLDMISNVYISTQAMQGTFKQFSKNKELIEKDTEESPTKYLDRLLDKYIIDYTDQGNVAKNIALSLFNSPSQDKIFDSTRKSSDLLGSTLERYNKLNAITSSNSNLSDDYLNNQAKLRNEQNQQYQKIAKYRKTELEKFNLIADMSAQSANLLKELSDAATKFLEQSKSRAIDNNKTTRTQINIAVGSFIFSILLSGCALYFSYMSYQQDKQNNTSNEKWQNELIDLQKNSLATNTLLDQELLSTKSEMIAVKIELGNLKKDLATVQSKKK